MKKIVFILVLITFSLYSECTNDGLRWPIECVPGRNCNVKYPDIDEDDIAFDCGHPGYKGHQGTDIDAEKGLDVYAADDGIVIWVFDGKDDNCPSDSDDCKEPNGMTTSGYRVCTEPGDYCDFGRCILCFDGGNVVVIKHPDNGKVFATRYDHLKKFSILVSPGDTVSKGEKIGEVGSAGHSTGSHLHFEVWGTGYYKLAEPWVGSCGPNKTDYLWESKDNLPWEYLDIPIKCGNSICSNNEKCINGTCKGKSKGKGNKKHCSYSNSSTFSIFPFFIFFFFFYYKKYEKHKK